MAVDVVPFLNDMIQTSFKGNVMKDRRAMMVSKRIRDGTATLSDAHTYAESLGEDLSKALMDNLTAANLPNGTLYYNIAQRTVVPALEQNYELVNEVASQIQSIVDKKGKIGLKSVKADFPKERIQGLIDKMTSDDITLEEVTAWLKEPIINNSEAFADDYVEANAKFRTQSGLKAKLVRKAEAKCCDWCAALEGEYDYGSAPEDIYRRHEFCRCTVTYKTEKVSQSVWSKTKWETPKEDLEQRRNAGERQEMTAEERQEQLNQLKRDADIKRFQKATGYRRLTAQQSTKGKTPEEVTAAINKIKERQKALGR